MPWPSKIPSPFNKRKGPDGKTHEGWCAIFEGDCCSCSGRSRQRPPKPEPLSGAPKRQLEDA
jgi:hypothetical protein